MALPLTAPRAGGDVPTLVARTLEQQERIDVVNWQLAGLRGRLEAQQAALAQERQAAAQATAEARSLSQAHVGLQARNGDLAKLVIAATLLHDSLDEDDVLRAVGEVVINLVGSEEFAVVEAADDGAVTVLASVGVDPARIRPPRESATLARALESGEAQVDPDPAAANPGEPIACIPLRTGTACGAAVVIHGLLPQKDGWVAFDQELFALLHLHAGRALYTARLHRRAG